jgi:hypothetical protein
MRLPETSARARFVRGRAPIWLGTSLHCAALAFGVACGDDTDEPVDPNPSFDQWCDRAPCGWQVDQGSVQRVSTWHERDYAVELAAPGSVQISQLRRATAAQCLTFDMIARVDADAHLTLRIDFNDDGQTELSQSLANLDWKSVPFTIATPTFYDDVRFTLLKEGKGKAVVAQIVVIGEDECPIFPLRLGAGSRCEDDSVCKADLRCLEATCQRAEGVRAATGSE